VQEIENRDDWPGTVEMSTQQREVLCCGILIKDFTQGFLHHVFSNYDIKLYYTIQGQFPIQRFTSNSPHSLTNILIGGVWHALCVFVKEMIQLP
jgi:hypothetical protein